ncbi:MAG: hypothetical protein WC146_00825 [Patescibacteria group bacterium]|jgi:3D (Asp-Asp-Asp) domain-containing protein
MKILKTLKEEVVPLSRRQSIIILVVIACIFQFTLFHAPALADEAVIKAAAASGQEDIVSNDSTLKETAMDPEAAKILDSTTQATEVIIEEIAPEATPAPSIKVIRTSTHVLTAYNSEAAQTDSTPCITANGFDVCEHGIEDTIAANFLKFGTKVMIPELFGDRIFVVRDRMNKRYPDRVDIWMISKQDARKFGVKTATIQVIEVE